MPGWSEDVQREQGVGQQEQKKKEAQSEVEFHIEEIQQGACTRRRGTLARRGREDCRDWAR